MEPSTYEEVLRDIVERLARIETHLEHSSDHEARITALERWRVRSVAFAAAAGAAGAHFSPYLTPLLAILTGSARIS